MVLLLAIRRRMKLKCRCWMGTQLWMKMGGLLRSLRLDVELLMGCCVCRICNQGGWRTTWLRLLGGLAKLILLKWWGSMCRRGWQLLLVSRLLPYCLNSVMMVLLVRHTAAAVFLLQIFLILPLSLIIWKVIFITIKLFWAAWTIVVWYLPFILFVLHTVIIYHDHKMAPLSWLIFRYRWTLNTVASQLLVMRWFPATSTVFCVIICDRRVIVEIAPSVIERGLTSKTARGNIDSIIMDIVCVLPGLDGLKLSFPLLTAQLFHVISSWYASWILCLIRDSRRWGKVLLLRLLRATLWRSSSPTLLSTFSCHCNVLLLLGHSSTFPLDLLSLFAIVEILQLRWIIAQAHHWRLLLLRIGDFWLLLLCLWSVRTSNLH